MNIIKKSINFKKYIFNKTTTQYKQLSTTTLHNINNNTHDEYQYLNLIDNIIQNGDTKIGRNGETISLFGVQMRYSLKDNTLPLLTTKKVAWKACLHELFWFIHGHTNNNYLKQNNVKIWNDNSTRAFLDSRGLYNYNEDELGPIYGFQWRNFNGFYISEKNRPNNHDSNYIKNGVDQLNFIINSLNNKTTEGRYSRRLIVSAWNPCQIDLMALPPCHVLFQLYVNSKDELSCSLYQRSGDVGLGIPFNIASYSFLTHIIAHHCGLKTGDFIHNIGDAHIYKEHVDSLKTQLKREPYLFPKINILNKYDNIDDYNFNDISIDNYKYYPSIKMKMIA